MKFTRAWNEVLPTFSGAINLKDRIAYMTANKFITSNPNYIHGVICHFFSIDYTTWAWSSMVTCKTVNHEPMLKTLNE